MASGIPLYMFPSLYGLLALVILLTRGRRFEETIGLQWVTTLVLRRTLVSISNATSFKMRIFQFVDLPNEPARAD